MKQYILSLAVVLLANSQLSFAYDFECDGMYFNIINGKDVAITCKTTDDGGYSGNLTIPETIVHDGETYNVVSIHYQAFHYCSLKRITIPKSITEIGDEAFSGCNKLNTVIIEDSKEQLYCGHNGYSTYSGLFKDSPVEYLYLGRNLSYTFKSGYYTYSPAPFQQIEELSTVIIGDKVTKIPISCFYYCTNLKKIEIPQNVDSIESSSFSGVNLSCLICHRNEPPYYEDNKQSYNRIYADNIIVPKGSLERYKNWANGSIYPITDIICDQYQTFESFELLKNQRNKNTVTSVAFYNGIDSRLTYEKITENMNPNCLYLFKDGAINGVNVISLKDNTSNRIEICSGYPFISPVNCKTEEITYTLNPQTWADGNKGWETIVLPFEPNYIESENKGNISPITTGSSGNFWLRQYVGSSDDAVYFASTSDGVMKANTPYLIAFPGDKMGKGSLEGQTITFKAKNVTIPVTEVPSIQKNGYTFVGNYDKTADEGGGWTLNTEGSAFVWSETVGDKPFSGYFKGEAPTASSAALRMSFGQMDNTTGLEQNMAELIDYADEVVYTLDGRKVIAKDLKPGLYIKNNKKMMVR